MANLPFEAMAARYKLAGGSIRGAALTAAHRAAADGRSQVDLVDVLAGVKEEYQKLGQPGDPGMFDPAQLGTGG